MNVRRMAHWYVRLVVPGLALLSLPALAQEFEQLPSRGNDFSFQYLQVGFEAGDIENPRSNVNNFFFDGSWELDEHLFVRGGLSYFDGRTRRGRPRLDVDGHRIYGGLGFNTPLEQDLDLVLSGDLVRVRARFEDAGSDSEVGFDLRGGVRYRATERVELSGGAFHENIDRSELGLYGEAMYQMNAPVKAGARLMLGGDVTTFGLFGRYDF